MKTGSKTLLTVLCAMLLVVVSVCGTLAYLTSQDTVVNTFTVGKVEIVLDEQDTDSSKTNATTEGRDKKNSYHFIPGNEYVKDPTIHIDDNSEDAYIVAQVTVGADLKETKLWQSNGESGYVGILGFVKGGVADATTVDANLESITYAAGDGTNKEIHTDKTLVSKVISEYGDVYIVQNYETNQTTFTYYFAKAQTKGTEIVLFEKLLIDGTWTNDDLAKLVKFNATTGRYEFVMDVKAYAVQADGFNNVFAAYEASFPELLQ